MTKNAKQGDLVASLPPFYLLCQRVLTLKAEPPERT